MKLSYNCHCVRIFVKSLYDVGVSGSGRRLGAHSSTVKSALTLIETKSSECGLCARDIDMLVTVATSSKLREFF